MNKKKQGFVKLSGCLPAFEEEREQCRLAYVVLIGHNARVYSGVVEYMKYEA